MYGISIRRPLPERVGLLALLLLAPALSAQIVPIVRVQPDLPLDAAPTPARGPSNLQRALAQYAPGPVRLALASGQYLLEPEAFTDSTCGNCEDASTRVPGTRGLLVRGTGIEIVGTDADSVVIRTGAGYGIYFDGCDGCSLARLAVTGGIRDPDPRATNAGVVVRDGSASIANCRIHDNIGDSAIVAEVVVGIAGVVGREGSRIHLGRCRIERNSWDGVALYRGAEADIVHNLIDGVDAARGAQVGGGRGVGIGLTWDAQAWVARNRVTRYWKGIGVFVNARARVHENVVEDILTWGLAIWGAGDGRPAGIFEDNAVFTTGACGMIVAVETLGGESRVERNAFVRTGQDERYDSGDPYCTQRPIARDGVPADLRIADNFLHDVRQPGDAPRQAVLDAGAFRRQAEGLLDQLRQSEFTARSRFMRLMASP